MKGCVISGNSDLIYTLAFAHSDQFPAACYYRETIQPLRTTFTIWVHLQLVWTKEKSKYRKRIMLLHFKCCPQELLTSDPERFTGAPRAKGDTLSMCIAQPFTCHAGSGTIG